MNDKIIGICGYCQSEMTGRIDKKFCDNYCRSTFHYEKAKHEEPKFFKKVSDKLKTNRKLLMHFNRGGTVKVNAELLLDKKFDPHFFTHHWIDPKGELFLFCFEIGFRRKWENGMEKYILIRWKETMKVSEFS